MIYFVIGLCFGLVVMAIICEKAHKKEVEVLRKQIERDSKYHYESIKTLEDELTTQRNVVKSLNDDNVRLRKRLSKKNEANSKNS